MREACDEIKSLKYSKTLSTSIQDDKHRRQVDVAKKRAAAQNVDYPTFAAMVSAAHLKPIDRKKMLLPSVDTEKPVPAWSFDSSGNVNRDQDNTKQEDAAVSSKQDVLDSLAKLKWMELKTSKINMEHSLVKEAKPAAMTGDAFRKTWNSIPKDLLEKRVEFLTSLPPSTFQRVFKVEVPVGMLEEMLLAVIGGLQNGHVDIGGVIAMLDSISSCSRFRISVKLVKGIVEHLLENIRVRAESEDQVSEIERLRLKFVK